MWSGATNTVCLQKFSCVYVKKLTPRYRKWMRRRAVREYRRRHKKPFVLGPVTTLTGTYLIRLGKHGEVPPNNFCFDENYEETAHFLAVLARRSLMTGPGRMTWPTSKHSGRMLFLRSYYDFSGVNNISTSAALVMAAIYDRARRVTGINPVAVRLHEWNPLVRRTMRELGFFDLLGIQENVPQDIDAERMILSFRAGANVDPNQIGGPDSVIERLFAFIGANRAMEVQLYSAVIEAMNNVRDHAYPETYFYRQKHLKFWWLTGAADRLSRKLTLSLYDQGITVPVSLPNTWDVKQLVGTILEQFKLNYDPLDTKYDGAAIGAATLVSRSSTGLSHRGLGLAKIREVVDALQGGRLRIISRFGDFVAQSGADPIVRTCQTPLEGTLVEIEAAF